MEETTWGDSEHPWGEPGHLFTKGPATYKIPSVNDVPSDMRIKLMDRSNPFAVHSSKVRQTLFLLPATAGCHIDGKGSRNGLDTALINTVVVFHCSSHGWRCTLLLPSPGDTLCAPLTGVHPNTAALGFQDLGKASLCKGVLGIL